MSLYLILFISMIIVSIYVRKHNVIVNYGFRQGVLDVDLFYIFALMLFVMVIFCYSRSHDYYVYKDIYGAAPAHIDIFSDYYSSQIHTEIGWKLLCNIFRALGMNYEVFIGSISGVSFIILCKFIVNNCNMNKCFALTWTYASFYLVYFYIGIRSTLPITIFITFMIPQLAIKKYRKYFFLGCICISIHTASIFFLIIPFCACIKNTMLRKILYISIPIGVICQFLGIYDGLLYMMPYFIRQHFAESGTNLTLQVLYRLVFVVFVEITYKKVPYNKLFLLYYKTYLIGSIFYFMTLGLPTFSVRIFDLIKPLEIIFISRYISKGQNRFYVFILAIIIASVMYIYHIRGFVNTVNSGFNFTIFDFPYVSIFNKVEIMK